MTDAMACAPAPSSACFQGASPCELRAEHVPRLRKDHRWHISSTACCRQVNPVSDCPLYPELWEHLRMRGMPDQRLQVKDVPGKGRALIAQTRINKGEKLLEVRFHL